MKKITLLTVLITVLISCSKDNSISNGTVPKSGTFSIDNTVYNIERTYIINNYINAEMGDINKLVEIHIFYSNDSTSNYSANIFKSGGNSSMYTSYYFNKNSSNIINSDKSKIKCIKNSNDTYTVKGTIYMYEDSDSTKRVTVGVNFITL